MKNKSKVVAYLMWFLLGFHHAYIGDWIKQLLLISMPVVGYLLFLAGTVSRFENVGLIGVWLFVISILWYFSDLFLIPGYVDSKNKKLSEKRISPII